MRRDADGNGQRQGPEWWVWVFAAAMTVCVYLPFWISLHPGVWAGGFGWV